MLRHVGFLGVDGGHFVSVIHCDYNEPLAMLYWAGTPHAPIHGRLSVMVKGCGEVQCRRESLKELGCR